MKILRKGRQRETNDDLSALTGRGVEVVTMNQGDRHTAIFYNGVLSGFSWFGQSLTFFNNSRELKNHFGKSGRGNWTDMFPARSRPAELFYKLYKKEAKKYLQDAVAAYLVDNPEDAENEYFIEEKAKLDSL